MGRHEGDNMRLSSEAFKEDEVIPAEYTCQGPDVNPGLAWDEPPKGTESFALIIDDPDAPVGTWVHWLVKDISKDMRNIPKDSVPGTEVKNSFGKKGYGGPCPPSGTHRYFFRLYALNIERLNADNIEEFYELVEEHKLEEAVLIGKYKKS